MNYLKGIPQKEIIQTRFAIKTVGRIDKLYETIKAIKKDGKKRNLLITYSFPAPGSTFPSTISDGKGGTKEVRTEVVESPIALGLFSRYFVKAFKQITDVIEYDFPGIKIYIRKNGKGRYEKEPRDLSYRVNVDSSDGSGFGDINIFWMPLDFLGVLAACASEFYTNVGETSNAGLSLILNSQSDIRADNDLALFDVAITGGPVQKNRFSLMSILVHELCHKFGIGHADVEGKPRFLDTICFGSQRANIPHDIRFRNGLWNDYYMRAALAKIYEYDLTGSFINSQNAKK